MTVFPRSRVGHSTAEPLRVHIYSMGCAPQLSFFAHTLIDGGCELVTCAIQNESGDSSGGIKCVIRHNANYFQHSGIYA